MKIPKEIPTYGDTSFRGECPKEEVEQVNFYSWLRFNHPAISELFLHPKAEGKRSGAQINHDHRTGGIPTSMPDCMIIHRVPFCVELKRKDHTKSRWQKGQKEKLMTMKEHGCFIGVALGCEGMKEAFELWLDTTGQK